MSGTDLSFLMDLPVSLKVLSLHSCQLLGIIPETIFHLPDLQFLDLSYNQYLSGNLPLLKWTNPNLNTLDLSSTCFSGELPESIGSLVSLEILWLGNCNFSGFIPISIRKLSRLLRVDLSFNKFSGRIPYSFSNLYQLKYLALSSNALGGPIPNIFTNMTQLDSLDFSNNNLVGDLTLSSLLSIPSLQRLDLSGNQLSGTIAEFTAAKLVKINLSGNKFQGQIPASMFKLENLTDFRVSSNRLTGIKGLELLSQLQTLKILDLSHNLLSESNICSVELSIPNLQWLRLSWNNLSEFPAFLKSSKNLNWLDLSGNRLVGRVPDWIWEVGKDSLSYLNLSHNSLQSFEQIPWENLMYLDLSSNMIQGEIPPTPATSQILLGFFISDNQFTGGIPSSICNQQSMQYLVLSNNSLSGMIPQCLGNFSMNLEVLDLKENRMSGAISYLSFEEDNSLTSLHLSSNQLQGPLPQSLINCKKLQVLDLGNNNLSDKFPSWLEILPSLKILALRSNKLYGTIIDSNPDYLFPFQQLRILDLSNNEFSGQLPVRYLENMRAMKSRDEDDDLQLHYVGQGYYHDSITLTMKGLGLSIGRIITIFTVIDFSSNKLEGNIPEVIGDLIFLKGVNLSHNSLNGHIPSSLRNLKDLEWLDLSSNELIGEISSDLLQLTFLEQLNLSHNQLVGPIPQGYQFNTFQADSYIGNPGLCGPPLSLECADHDSHVPELPGEDNSEDLDELERKFVVIGYGVGIVVGLLVGTQVIGQRLLVKLMQRYVPETTQTLLVGWSRWSEG